MEQECLLFEDMCEYFDGFGFKSKESQEYAVFETMLKIDLEKDQLIYAKESPEQAI
jgi:hypothetical protein